VCEMKITMDLKDTLTLLIASYAAVLSSYLAWRDHRPHARVVGKITHIIAPRLNRNSAPILSSEIANLGRQTITLSSFGWQEPNGKYLTCLVPLGNVSVPYELAAGKSVNFGMWACDVVAQVKESGYKGAVKLRPLFIDQTGRRYRGKVFRLALDDDWEEPDEFGRKLGM
jgi:hypothetical protein